MYVGIRLLLQCLGNGCYLNVKHVNIGHKNTFHFHTHTHDVIRSVNKKTIWIAMEILAMQRVHLKHNSAMQLTICCPFGWTWEGDGWGRRHETNQTLIGIDYRSNEHNISRSGVRMHSAYFETIFRINAWFNQSENSSANLSLSQSEQTIKETCNLRNKRTIVGNSNAFLKWLATFGFV